MADCSTEVQELLLLLLPLLLLVFKAFKARKSAVPVGKYRKHSTSGTPEK